MKENNINKLHGTKKLPLPAKLLLKRMKLYQNNHSVLEDFEETYNEILESEGRFKAKSWCYRSTLKSICGYMIFVIQWSLFMFKNYLYIALRNIKRFKGYSVINIAGLSVGLACCILIFLYVQYEFSYDKYHENSENIYRVIRDEPENIERGGTTMENSCPAILAQTIRSSFSEVSSVARLRKDPVFLELNGSFIQEDKFFYADPEIFEIFTFPFISGRQETALIEPFSLVITREAAKKYFGNEDPVNRTVKYFFEFFGKRIEHDLKITGVLENIAGNSHFKFDFIASNATLFSLLDQKMFGWDDGVSYKTYVLLNTNSNIKNLESGITGVLQKNSPEQYKNNILYLQSLTSIHLSGNIQNEIEKNSTKTYIYLFSVIAFLIMTVACFNYMNLSTARSAGRAKEIGIRKVLGANRKDLVRQFFAESFLFSFIALLISIFLVLLILPQFNSLVEKEINIKSLNSGFLLVGVLLLTITVSVFSGSYPAVFLSSFNPVRVMKGRNNTGPNKIFRFRNILVILQFSVSVFIIIATLFIYKQLSFIQERELGFNKEHVLYIQSSSGLTEKYNTFKAELSKNPNILNMTLSSGTPASTYTVGGVDWEGETPDDEILWNTFCVDYDFMKTLKFEMAEGRFFREDHSADVTNYVINETAVSILGWEQPLGKMFSIWRKEGQVIGVLKDFHFKSLHEQIQPLVLRIVPDYKELYEVVILRLASDNISETIGFIKETFKNFESQYPFQYFFLDEQIDKLYRAEQKMGRTFNYISFLAIFIACLGLFGLLSFTIEQRTREIGIRKVLGAKTMNLVNIISREFLICVLAANIFAWPAAYWAVNKWLQNFAYRIEPGILTFVTASIILIVITIMTISVQITKAAAVNPVDTLRNE